MIGNVALIIGGVLLGVLLLAVAVKLVEVRRAAGWPRTRGRIVSSRVESRTVKRTTEASCTGNFARIEFEFRIGNRTLRGNRVSIGEQAPDFQVRETLDRYPVGREVDVFYNPANPEQAVLERDLPPNFSKGLGLALLYFGGGTLFAFAYLTRGVDWLSSRLPAGANAPLIALLVALGLAAVMVAWAKQRQSAQTREWDTVPGEIVAATVDSFTASTADSDSVRLRHAPRVTYRYARSGREYESSRLHFGAAVSYGSEAQARAKLGAYPIGKAVRVLVDPRNPTEATLDGRARHLWLLWVVAALLLALAWLAAQPVTPRA